MQAERDALRRQLEQSEASRARYKAEVGNLQGYIKELEYVESLETAAELSTPAEPAPQSPAVPDGSISLEELATKARLPVETLLSELEKKGRVSAGSQNWVMSEDSPERFVVQPKTQKRKNNNAR